jgi:hypothetical protein
MKGRRNGYCSMITTINCKSTKSNPLNTLSLHPLNTEILLAVINIRTGGEQNEYGIREGVVISGK